MRRTSLLLTFLILCAAKSSPQRVYSGTGEWGRNYSVWTEFSSPKCQPLRSEPTQPAKMCPGPAGYKLLVAGAEASPTLTVLAPNGSRHLLQYWDVNAPEFESLRKSVSWQVGRRGRKVTPFALFLSVSVKKDPYSRNQDPYTVIAKLTVAEVCVVGRIRPSGSSAADITGISGGAPHLKCLELGDKGQKDWLGLVYGLMDQGRYEEAKATVKLMPEPYERTIAYQRMAKGQAESGDFNGARETLRLGLDEARNRKDEAERFRMLMGIISVITEVGLYDEVKGALLFLQTSQLPQALVMVGKIQGDSHVRGGREDIDSARETFNKAVEIELRRQDTVTADKHLADIVEGQAQVGLVKEARQTLSLIKDAATRKIAEGHITWWSAKPD